MKALVCGGHKYRLNWHVYHVLTILHAERHFTQIIHGAAPGVDEFAGDWAWMNYIDVRAFPAKWDVYKNRAGHIRNVTMLVEGKPDIGIVFPGANGTSDMRSLMVNKGLEIIDVPEFNVEDLL